MKTHFCIILALMLLVRSSTSFAQTNLYPDSISGFEIDFWLGSNTQPADAFNVGVVSDKVFDGEQAIKYDCPDASIPTGGHATVILGGTHSAYASGNIAVAEGNYIFNAKIFIEGTAPSNLLVYFAEKSVVITDEKTLTIPLSGVTTGSWQTISKPVTFFENIAEMKTGIRVRGVDYSGLTGTSTIYIDQMGLFPEETNPTDTIYSPILDLNNTWEMNTEYSDEFNNPGIDQEKWNIDVNDWGTWSWEPENATSPDTVLALKMQQKQHTRGGKEYYFTSGIVQIRKIITYGYFEAKIKASAKGQGTCPAFWLYSVGQPTPTEEGGVQYSEIDAVEIFQVPNQLKRLEMNLHTRIIENGVLTWKRPGQGDTELTHNLWVAPWDPRDDFHTYAVWNRLDSIFWYVDGIQRGAKKNYYWHLPMHLTVSMGLRTPYEKYIDGVRTAMPYPESNPEPGFPTTMFCDYVRVWNTSPQLVTEMDDYKNKEFSNQNNLEFECRYFAGNGEAVQQKNNLNGVSCLLQELDKDGNVVREIAASDQSTLGKESGKANISLNLSNVNSTSALTDGHYYVLKPVLTSSLNGGTDVVLAEGPIPITIVGNVVSVSEQQHTSEMKVYPNPADNIVTIEMVSGRNSIKIISVYDVNGNLVLQKNIQNSGVEKIDVSGLAPGVYWIKAGAFTSKLVILLNVYS